MKTKLFKRVILKKEDNNLDVNCLSKDQTNSLEIYSNKKNFFGLKFKNEICNLNKRLDRLVTQIKFDFPFLNPNI